LARCLISNQGTELARPQFRDRSSLIEGRMALFDIQKTAQNAAGSVGAAVVCSRYWFATRRLPTATRH